MSNETEYDRGWKDGHKHGAWASKHEPQAQEGEPDPLYEVDTHGRLQATKPHSVSPGDKFITLQSHREAMAKLEQQKNHWQDQWSDACNENQHLLNVITKRDEELKKCEKDAERYRWLRDRIDPREIEERYVLRGYNVDQRVSEKTDAAVDDAITQAKEAMR